jgi:hypothetical protein
MNDALMGYEINNTSLTPQRNEVIRRAFEAQGITVVEQNYKKTMMVSDRDPADLAEAVRRATAEIDAGMLPVLRSSLEIGLDYWTATRDSRPPGDAERASAAKRVEAITALLQRLGAEGEFRFDFHMGAAVVDQGAEARYVDLLNAEMDSTKAALMARDARVERTVDVGDPRTVAFSRDQFVQFCRETVALKRAIGDAELPYRGQSKRVFGADGTMNRDLLRAIRKEIYHEPLTSAQHETLSLLQQYFQRANVFDYIKEYTSDEVDAHGEQAAEALALMERLRGGEPVPPDIVERIAEILRGEMAVTRTASEAQFYTRAASLQNRAVLNADIKDFGLNAFDGFGTAVDAVGSGRTTDLTRASLAATDRNVEFRRAAAAEFERYYREELVPLARERAREAGREDLLESLEAEADPLILFGGDEITVSMHGLFEELGLLHLMSERLTDPAVGNARVAVTHTDGTMSGAEGHADAMNRGQAGQDLLKGDYEVAARDLRQRAPTLDPERAARAVQLADRLDRIYASEERGTIVLYDRAGERVDAAALDAELAALLGPREAH